MIYVHLADGFEEIEATTVVDVLRRAELEVKFVSIADTPTVMGAHNIAIKADLMFADTNYDVCDMILLPGGMPGTKNLAEHKGLCEKIREFDKKGKWLAAICAAPLVLAQCGVLKDTPATIFQGMESELLDAKFLPDRVVVSGNKITSRGPGTAFEFSLKIVELLKGGSLSSQLKDQMMVE